MKYAIIITCLFIASCSFKKTEKLDRNTSPLVDSASLDSDGDGLNDSVDKVYWAT